jgi:hypothetical protein
MSGEKLRVLCQKPDCIHYHPDDKGDPEMCLCAHPDKGYHKHQNPCPLYRVDWKKQRDGVNLDDW